MDFTKKWISLGLAALTVFGMGVRMTARTDDAALANTLAPVQNAAVTQRPLQTRLHTPTMDWLLPTETDAGTPGPGTAPADAPEDVSGIPDFIPPLLRLAKPVRFEEQDGALVPLREPGEVPEAQIRADASRFLELAGRDPAITESAPPEETAPGAEDFWAALPENGCAAAEEGLRDGFTLFLKPAENVRVTASACGISLTLLTQRREDGDYAAALAEDPFFAALTAFYGIDRPAFLRGRGTEETAVDLTCFQKEEDPTEEALRFCVCPIRISGGETEEGVRLTAAAENAGGRGARAEDYRHYPVAEAKKTADAACAAKDLSPDKPLGAKIVWYYDKTGTYLVPAYRFFYQTDNPAADGTVSIHSETVPAYDLYLYLTPAPEMLGDADNNGKITAADARLIIRAAVSLEEPDWPAIYDVTQDGSLTARDARDCLRVSVDLPIGEEERKLELEKESSRAEEQSRRAEEARRKAEEESRRAEEESRRAEEESRRAEEESRKAEEERKRKEAEQRRADFLAIYNQVSYDDLSDNMRWLVNDIGVRSWWNSTQNSAANKIYDRLVSYGYTGGNCQKLDFTKGGITGRNVMATIPTAAKDPKILLVLSHYDTARGTGAAVDNGSGAVALLQLAKRFLQTGMDYGIEVRFLFTAGEEQGYYGAYAYVNSLSYAEKARHVLAFNMDMMGKPNNAYDPGRSYYLCASTEPVSTDGYYSGSAASNVGTDALSSAKNALGNLGEADFLLPVRAGVHDIVPFRKAGMTALTVSWRVKDSSRSSGADYGLASPDIIHMSYDNIANFDMNSLYNATRLVAGAVARILLPYTDL